MLAALLAAAAALFSTCSSESVSRWGTSVPRFPSYENIASLALVGSVQNVFSPASLDLHSWHSWHSWHSSSAYNNGPASTRFERRLLVAWYSGAAESVNNSVLLSWTFANKTFSPPVTLFPPVTGVYGSSHHQFPNPPGIGDESEPFIHVEDRLYAAASSWDLFGRENEGDKHRGLEIPLLRQIMCAANDTCSLGVIFWLSNTTPKGCVYTILCKFIFCLTCKAGFEHWNYDTLETLTDLQMRLDGERILHSFLNTTVNGSKLPNERSLFLRNNGRTAVLLLRSGLKERPYALLASEAQLTESAQIRVGECRFGTGIIAWAVTVAPVSMSVLNWSNPVFSNIPDTGSRTCIAPLRDGRLIMIGSQVPHASGRTLLSLSLSSDEGNTWDHIYAIRKSLSEKYDYPSAVENDDGSVTVLYAVNKHRIEAATIKLPEI